MRRVAILTLIAIIVTGIRCFKIQDLGGRWLLKDGSGEYSNLEATVPGGIYSDLMQNAIIGDVLYGYNDTATRWVAQRNWSYSSTFSVDDDFLSHGNINLIFDGLDTFAVIWLNNVTIGQTQNMFVRYILDVKKLLKIGNNTIRVEFTSPIEAAEDLSKTQDYEIPPSCPPKQYNGECHVNQIRKMQASFSWDLGPAVPSVGIWKKVYLEAFNSSAIRYVTATTQEVPDDYFQVQISTYLDAGSSNRSVGVLVHKLQTDTGVISQFVEVDAKAEDDGEIKVDFSFVIPKAHVKQWWPNGLGEQNLYNLSTEFASGTELNSKSIRIGFRKIELVQEPLEQGLSFYFKVNDVPFFAKGANEIPLDILPERGQNPQLVSRVLRSAREANMNMLRVWGGGVYESDFFYDTADELGILIWQDFMFACAMYPSYPQFLTNVVDEVRHQVRRLQHHASIALWAGNNENEAALAGNWYGTSKNTTLYDQDYVKLYVQTIKKELAKVSNDLIFLTSSPTNGLESDDENNTAKNPQDPLYGDVHYYNYILNSLDINTYPIPRFASEFGYQSQPAVDSWLTATDNVTNLNPMSDFMNHRQHHPLALLENHLLISYQLNLPNSSSPDYYKAYIYYSQIVQAASIKFETEMYRSYMGRLNDQGKGNTMGALFWQLNDVWVAPTWSGIDYTGKWKMLHYFAKDFFAPTIITGFLDVQRQLNVYVVSDVPSLINTNLGVTAVIEVFKWNSFQPLNTTEVTGRLEFGKSNPIFTLDTDSFLTSLGCGVLINAKTNCFFRLTLEYNGVPIAPPNAVFPGKLKDSAIQQAQLKISAVNQIDNDGKRFQLTIQTDQIALFVWLDSPQIAGRFSDNGFLLVSPTRTINFTADEGTSEAALAKALTVTHLKDPQY